MRELSEWTGLASGCAELAELISQTYQPDRVVAIARGGVIPGLLIASAMDVDRFDSITVRYSDTDRTMPSLRSPLPIDLDDSQVLLVEDFLLSGQSLAFAATLLQEAGATVRSAACGYCQDALHRPDFSLGSAPQPPAFPWER
jgi:hypoxanthine phosphoribosyltransferase